MKIIYSNYEPCYKIYKISESVSNQYYIGKTKRPMIERLSFHMIGDLKCDVHFGGVGWNNCICEIIDHANDSETLSKKEIELIKEHIGDENMLNVQYNTPIMNDVKVDVSDGENMIVICVYDEDEQQNVIKIVDNEIKD